MYEFLNALGISAAIYAYWFSCRKSSLVKRHAASRALIALVDRADVSDEKKFKAAWFYEKMTKWYSLPAFTFLGFPIVIYGIFSGGIERAKTASDKADDDALNAAWQMYLIRNPLTTVVCLTFMSVVITLVTPLAIITNKLKSIPSLSQGVISIAESAADTHSHHHLR